jgi:hypothetical protein
MRKPGTQHGRTAMSVHTAEYARLKLEPAQCGTCAHMRQFCAVLYPNGRAEVLPRLDPSLIHPRPLASVIRSRSHKQFQIFWPNLPMPLPLGGPKPSSGYVSSYSACAAVQNIAAFVYGYYVSAA